jgi:hypothetical protein
MIPSDQVGIRSYNFRGITAHAYRPAHLVSLDQCCGYPKSELGKMKSTTVMLGSSASSSFFTSANKSSIAEVGCYIADECCFLSRIAFSG